MRTIYEVRYDDGDYYYTLARLQDESGAKRIQQAWGAVELRVVPVPVDDLPVIPDDLDVAWYVDRDYIKNSGEFCEDFAADDPSDEKALRIVNQVEHFQHGSWGYLYAPDLWRAKALLDEQRMAQELPAIAWESSDDD